MDYPYNLHTHSLLSDGCLLPSEIAVRYAAAGYKAIAITDHVDYSNIATVIAAIDRFRSRWPKDFPLKVLAGVEITHVPLSQAAALVRYARENGAQIVIGHGETVSEPVLEGTNRAFIEAKVDILAHPGHITDEDALLAAKKGVLLEVTTRKSHGGTNGEVVRKALKWGAGLVLDHDSHAPSDIITPAQTASIARSAGLSDTRIAAVADSVSRLIRRKSK
ncbi:MAG: histidinol phosphate phosphatase domain-containing protein [Deltaproteobacteria bacterium]